MYVFLIKDTYPNSRHKFSFPRVMPMIGDGKTSVSILSLTLLYNELLI